MVTGRCIDNLEEVVVLAKNGTRNGLLKAGGNVIGRCWSSFPLLLTVPDLGTENELMSLTTEVIDGIA